MNAVPTHIGGLKVVEYSPVGGRHRATGACRHTIDDIPIPQVARLAICEESEQQAFRLFYCDTGWKVIADTWHASLEDAKRQAEFEYEGVSQTLKAVERSIDTPATGETE